MLVHERRGAVLGPRDRMLPLPNQRATATSCWHRSTANKRPLPRWTIAIVRELVSVRLMLRLRERHAVPCWHRAPANNGPLLRWTRSVSSTIRDHDARSATTMRKSRRRVTMRCPALLVPRYFWSIPITALPFSENLMRRCAERGKRVGTARGINRLSASGRPRRGAAGPAAPTSRRIARLRLTARD